MKFTDNQIKRRVAAYESTGKYTELQLQHIENHLNRWNNYQDWLVEKAAHDNWVDITTYDARLAQYELDMTAYNDWVWSEATPERPDMPEYVIKPDGYYTQEEVDESIAAHTEWEVGYNAWLADTSELKPSEYWVDEPEVLKLPADLPEPTIPVLPDPVPNTPEPEFTQEELDAQAYAQSRVERTQAVENIQVTTTAGNTFDGDEVAQGRMARAILSLPDDTTTISWKRSDNTFADITKLELAEALALAGAEQAALWVQYG